MNGYPETAPPVPLAETVQRVILHRISWTTYERLLIEHEESSNTHFTYDRGMLEIMVLCFYNSSTGKLSFDDTLGPCQTELRATTDTAPDQGGSMVLGWG